MKLEIIMVRFCIRQLIQTACLLFLLFNTSPEQLMAQVNTVQEKNKKLIMFESEEIGNKGDLDKIPELYIKDFVRHLLYNDSQTKGLDDFRVQMAQLHRAFPDWAENIMLMIAEKDMVAIWFIASGTNTGNLPNNSPTGRKTVHNVMSFYRIADEKIAEQWLLPDLFSMNSHLGLVPGKAATEIDNQGIRQVAEPDMALNFTDVQRNKDLAVMANKQVWNLGNFETLEEIFSDDFVQHFLPFGTQIEGIEEFRKQLISHREAFPDWAEVINLVVAEGDYVFLQFTSTGTNTGSFLGKPPTEKKININEVTIFRIANGKITEQWLLPDIFSLNQQLGFFTPDD